MEMQGCRQTQVAKVGAPGLILQYITLSTTSIYFLFGEFLNEELSRRRLASNSLLRLEEMYEDPTFMTLHAQLNLVKAKRPSLLSYLNYLQEQIPNVPQEHEKIECQYTFSAWMPQEAR